jgi:GT2 family glycosyltransferase
MKQKKVGIIVVTFNRKKLLRECLESLLKQSYKNFEILLIDNASTDGTHEYVEDLIDGKKLQYFNTGANIGGAGGFNYGLREALKRDYDYAWLMDDDSIAEDPKALEILVEKAKFLKDDFSFLAGLVKWTDGDLCVMNIPKLDEQGWHNKYDYYKEGIVPIETSTFVSFFANMKIVKKAGLPIKEFFIYGDDWEYSLRMRKFAQPYMVTDSVMTHKMGINSTANIVDCPVDRIDRCRYDYRNRAYVIRNYGAKKDKLVRKYQYFTFISKFTKLNTFIYNGYSYYFYI